MYPWYKEGVLTLKTASISIGGITAAIKARSVLAENGIRAKLIKFSSLKKGCNYGIRIKENEYMEMARILRSAGIEYSIFKEAP